MISPSVLQMVPAFLLIFKIHINVIIVYDLDDDGH